ncbi:MAG: hypothetical protein KF875_03320 [Trueperaceae bacterium]|nr:hypothetical protein [Trueperaceae bacterium]MCC6310567.1 hypothetical protein [Trueperaceae bacterium]MCO5174383.1 hypothetical protein [Trueperaceae bacterium]MCW5821104.1 hypothetical protein [Trueperaceae bacterium]
MMRQRTKTWPIVILLGALLGACAPARTQGGAALVAVLNAPAQSVLGGAAEGVQDVLERETAPGLNYVSSFTMRFLETHNDLFHSRAAPSAARIARTQGADLAVMIGAPVLERNVTASRDGRSRRVDVAVALEAQVVDPRTDAVVQVLRTRTLQGSRVEANDGELVAIDLDPTVQALRDQAVPELAAALSAELPYLTNSLLIGSSGG